MEAQVDAGSSKAIGVSNFSVKQIERILKNSRIPPATNQVEMHAYYQQRSLQEFSQRSLQDWRRFWRPLVDTLTGQWI